MYRGSMLVSRTSTVTESFSDYSPAQWIFVPTKIIAAGNAFRAMDLLCVAPPWHPHPHLRPMRTGLMLCVKTGQR